MNPAHVTPRVAREIFALEPELFYNLPDHAKNEEMCRRAVGHDGSYLQYVPEKWKRRSCAWRPYGAVPMPSPTCPRA